MALGGDRLPRRVSVGVTRLAVGEQGRCQRLARRPRLLAGPRAQRHLYCVAARRGAESGRRAAARQAALVRVRVRGRVRARVRVRVRVRVWLWVRVRARARAKARVRFSRPHRDRASDAAAPGTRQFTGRSPQRVTTAAAHLRRGVTVATEGLGRAGEVEPCRHRQARE